ncbi:outer membrane protein assembly factor BamA [Candidatus Dependentiae bacterium]|nr:outer membrane protein assembly factor BamA [Candidatus Dependentiae bacterium]
MQKKVSLKRLLSIFILTIFSYLNAESLPKINKIKIIGNKLVKKYAIMNRLPYRAGEKFDSTKTAAAINNIYSLGYFRQVRILKKDLKHNRVNLYVEVEEKKLLAKLEFEGNKNLSSSKIKEELNLDKLITIDEENLHQIAIAIKKLYAKESYHNVNIETKIITDKKSPDKATAKFIINQGPKSAVVRVFFKGNKNIPDRKLRKMVQTREEWLLSFMDESGIYQKDVLEMDKHRIEYLYKDDGYIKASVSKADVKFFDDNKKINVIFYINEGEQYKVDKVEAIGDDVVLSKELKEYVVVKEGKPYSQSKVIETINNLKEVWGRKGYINADVYPQTKVDDETKTIDITFHTEKGNRLYVNRIEITGNKVTRDKVVRRQIDFEEGDLITTRKLNRSKANVEYLSFFERGGVNWKIQRLDDKKANLIMNVKEAKTGNLQAGLTYGSDRYNSSPSLKGRVSVEKKNLFGLGFDSGLMIQANRHHLKQLEAHFFDPAIFDSDASVFATIYRRWEEYDQWANVTVVPKETVTGGMARLGFYLPQLDRRLQFLTEVGVEHIKNNKPRATGPNRAIFEPIVRQKFQQGTLAWLSLDLIKDTRNHQVYPNKGYKFIWHTKLAPPAVNEEYSFIKSELEGSWYTPLIGEDNLVLCIHAKTGAIASTGGTYYTQELDENGVETGTVEKKKIIPYKELYHMGGQNTVRGFTWGGIGPAWINNDPLGGKYMVQFNAELIFPLIPDYSMKAHFFYDAGAGWDTPKEEIPNTSYLKRDQFNLRHSVGFGLNLTQPMPAKIDWGYKLDRDKKAGESPHEFHLSMNYAW